MPCNIAVRGRGSLSQALLVRTQKTPKTEETNRLNELSAHFLSFIAWLDYVCIIYGKADSFWTEIYIQL